MQNTVEEWLEIVNSLAVVISWLSKCKVSVWSTGGYCHLKYLRSVVGCYPWLNLIDSFESNDISHGICVFLHLILTW